MRATVTRPLNVRIGSPRILPNNNPHDLFFRPGDVINIAEIVKGDVYKQNDVWYKLSDGGFVWSGGVGKVDEEPKRFNAYIVQCPNLINWNQSIPQLPAEWIQSKGRGVKVAILDSGIFSKHEDFNNSISIYEDVTKIKDKVDYTGHGTHVAGIIGSRSQTSNGVIGVAPECELIIIKALFDEIDGTTSNYDHIIAALDLAKKEGADIVNMSFRLQPGNSAEEIIKLKSESLRQKIKELSQANITMVAAGGDKADLKDEKIFFPASCEEVISVGAINEGHFTRNPDVSKQLNVVGPFINYFSLYKDSIFYQHLSGCSMVTAFISGILALAISNNRNSVTRRFTNQDLKDFLMDHSLSLSQLDYSNSTVFSYHSLNPS